MSHSNLYNLPDKYKVLQETCRKFAAQELAPIAGKLDQLNQFPHEQIKKLFEMGLMGVCVSPDYGGSGLDTLALSIAVEELSRGCSSTGVICSIHNALCVNLLDRCMNKDQKEKFLKSFVQDSIGYFALSESEAGSDVSSMSTVAKQEGDCYVLNGVKAWVTSAIEAKGGIVFATVDKSLRHKGITAFLVLNEATGVRVGPSEKKLGIRATSTCNLYLDDVRIPKENIIGSIGDGFKLAMNQLDQGRIGIASQALGIAQASLDTAILYASQRTAFGQSLLSMPTVKTRIAEMATKIQAARLLTRTAACIRDSQGSATILSSMAKLASSECATFASHNCIQIMGAQGIVNSMPAERLYRDARITEIYGGITDIQKIVIADQLMIEYGLKESINKR